VSEDDNGWDADAKGRPRHRWIPDGERGTCPVSELVAFLCDYPNVCDVFIVRRLTAKVTELEGAKAWQAESIKRLETGRDELQARVAELEADKSGLESVCESYNSRCAEAEGRAAELEIKCDELSRRELKSSPRWVELRTLKSGAVCDGQCGGEAGEACGTCKADEVWRARVAELERYETAAKILGLGSSIPEKEACGIQGVSAQLTAKVAELEDENAKMAKSWCEDEAKIDELQAQLDTAQAALRGKLDATAQQCVDFIEGVARESGRNAGENEQLRAEVTELQAQLDRAAKPGADEVDRPVTSTGNAFRSQVNRYARELGWDPDGSITESTEIKGMAPMALEFIKAQAKPRAELPKGMRRPHIMDTQLYDIEEAEGVPAEMYELLAYAQTLEEMQSHEPRPMSEAPRDGKSSIRIVYLGTWAGSRWVLGRPIGWLPTSSGGEGE
jgi:hypothetical protein